MTERSQVPYRQRETVDYGVCFLRANEKNINAAKMPASIEISQGTLFSSGAIPVFGSVGIVDTEGGGVIAAGATVDVVT